MATNRSKNLLDSLVRLPAPRVHDVLQFAAHFHLHLHSATSLEGRPAPNNESEIVSSQFRVTIGCVGIGVFCTCENGGALDPGLQSLLT